MDRIFGVSERDAIETRLLNIFTSFMGLSLEKNLHHPSPRAQKYDESRGHQAGTRERRLAFLFQSVRGTRRIAGQIGTAFTKPYKPSPSP
jgi:hypothetical protein